MSRPSAIVPCIAALMVAACGGESKQENAANRMSGTGGTAAHETCNPPEFPDPEVAWVLGPDSLAVPIEDVRGIMLNGVSSLSGLECLPWLQSLSVYSGTLTDLSPIQGLTDLSTLELYSVPVQSLEPLAGLMKLSKLVLNATAVTDLGPLAGLTKLVSLDISRSEIDVIDPLRGLPNLKLLLASDSSLTSLDPVVASPQLATIDVSLSAVTQLPSFGTPSGSCPTIRALETSLDDETVTKIIPALCARGWSVTWSPPGGDPVTCGPPCELHP